MEAGKLGAIQSRNWESGVKKSREQGAEENNYGATQKFLREQGDSKNHLGSIEI